MSRTVPKPRRRSTTGAALLRHLSALLVGASLLGCGEERDPAQDGDAMAVDPGAAMDTTPAGTPAPPPAGLVQEGQPGEVSVRLREWAVELDRDSVPAGEITFRAVNSGTREHALEVEGQGVEQETEPIRPGGSALLTVRLEPGTYQVYCPVVGEYDHEQMGMTTTLVVRAPDTPPTRP